RVSPVSTSPFFISPPLPHNGASAVFDPMQRARFFFDGDIHFRRRLSQLSPRISARLPQRREAVAVGSDQMVDLDFVEARPNEQTAPRSSGSNSRQRSGAARFAKRSDE